MPTFLIAVALTIGADPSPPARRVLPPVETLERMPVPSLIPLMRERRQVVDIPSSIVRLAKPPTWSAPAISPPGPPSALRVARNRLPMSAACGTFHDTIDLMAVRRNNFRLVGFDVEALPAPGFTLQTPAEGLAIDTSTRDVPTLDLPSAGQIRIRPPVYVSIKQRGACVSRYRVSMTLEGPRGADPFAARRNHDQRPYRRAGR